MSSVAKQTKLEKELAGILNKYCEENRSDTPDWILAVYLQGCLDAFNGAIFSRRVYYGENADELIKKLGEREEYKL